MGCQGCGADIPKAPGRGRPRLWCDECRRKPYQRKTPGKRKMYPCAVCGVLRTRSTSSRPVGQATCRKCCTAQIRAARATRVPPPLIQSRCDYCGTVIEDRKTRRFCSNNCSIRWLRPPQTAEERLAQSKARWRKRNHLKRARRRLADVSSAYEQALRAGAKCCPLCQVRMVQEPFTPASKELDHIVPMNAGGTHTIGNVRIICRLCNQRRPWDGSDYVGPVTLWSTA